MRFRWVPPRSHETEILDREVNRYEDLAAALRDIGLVNRWLGGSRAVVRPVLRLVEDAGLDEVSVLDVGTGAADVPLALAGALARRGVRVRAVGVDRDPSVVRYASNALAARTNNRSPREIMARPHGSSRPSAPMTGGHGFASAAPETPEEARRAAAVTIPRSDGHGARGRTLPPPAWLRGARAGGVEPSIAIVRADAFALPFDDRAFDLVTCSLFLHHFHEDAASRLLEEFARVARRAVVVNDLARHLAPWIGIRLFGRLIRASPMFRNDAPLSVLRGWTASELLEIAARAGLQRTARVLRPVPYRLALLVDTSAS